MEAKKTEHKVEKPTVEEEQLHHHPVAEKKSGKGFMIVLIIVVILGLAGIGATYYLMNKKLTEQKNKDSAEISVLQDKVTALEKDIAEAKAAATTTTTTTTTTSSLTSAQTKAAIEKAIPAKDYSSLSSFMADTVNVTYAASSKAGPVSKAQAITDMAYLSSGTSPWNFAIAAATLATYKNGSYKSFIGDDTIFGASANKYFVSFRLNSANKIDEIFISASTDLLP